MRKSLSYRQRILLLVLGCIFILGVVYVTCALTVVTSIKKVRLENKMLKEQYQAVESYIVNKDYYVEETQVNNEESLRLIDCYVNDVTDKSLLNDFDNFLKDFDLKSSALTLNDNEKIDEVTLNEKTYILQTNAVSASFDIKFSSLKKFLSNIRDADLNLSIQAISISPDEANASIAGAITFNQNSVYDAEEITKDPVYNSRTGINELFD